MRVINRSRDSTNVVRSQIRSQENGPSRAAFQLLLSCCIFFAIVSVCLAATLVFLGQHYLKNTPSKSIQTAASTEKSVGRTSTYRLTKNIRPHFYHLTLKPNLTSELYKGLVNISLEIKTHTESKLVVHSADLNMTKVQLFAYNGTKLPIKHYEDKNNEILIVSRENETVFNAGKYYFILEFHGSLANKLKGFYSSKYANGNDIRTIATTKFEPTYARKAFPCFDEPNFKANYSIHILVPDKPNYLALSNMPEKRPRQHSPEDNGYIVNFETSVKMSTYLAAFIVCDFDYQEDFFKSPDGSVSTPIRVYATPAQRNKTLYPLETGKKVMEFYLNYFQIPYPLPKLDMIAIPDFVSGAMENWGLVTFRETALLFDPEISSAVNQRRVATVIAHELAHSWFGNYVTMDWWDDLWLNEGFASYIEYKGVDAAHPEWQILSQFLLHDMHPALYLDATKSSHPIIRRVETPDEITEIFDIITYNKGASLLRMLEQTVGEKIFQDSVTAYLKKHAFGNAITNDLLNEIRRLSTSEVDIGEFIESFTVQAGYPLVSVQRIGDKYILTQKRFLYDQQGVSRDNSSSFNFKYTIPITYITSNNPSERKLKWFPFNAESIEIKEKVDWIKFNHQQVGFYRVNYGADEWAALIGAYARFETMDRAHLLDEVFAIARAGQISYDIALDLSKALTNEMGFVPWAAVIDHLLKLKMYLKSSPKYKDFLNYTVSLVTPALNNVTSDSVKNDTQFLNHLNRAQLVAFACNVEDPRTLSKTKGEFNAYLADPKNHRLDSDLRASIFKYGMKNATGDDWDKLWNLYVHESDAGEKNRLLVGLANIQSAEKITKLIDLAKDDTYIRSQDYFLMLVSISSSDVGNPIVWDYVRSHWTDLVTRFTINDRQFGSLMPKITNKFVTEQRLNEMKEFFAKYPNAGAGTAARKEALETVSNNINWVQHHLKTVESWLEKNSSKI